MKLLICIVFYNQKVGDSNAYRSLLAQDITICPQFYLFDNSPESTLHPITPNIYYTHNPNNPGLSVAFNHAAKYALENDFEWILLSDQDTRFSTDFLKKMQQATLQYPSVSLFAPIVKFFNNTHFSPCKFRNMVSRLLRNMSVGMNSLHDTMPINSGLLIKTNRFYEAGGYDESLRVDFCDYAFLNKVKRIDDKYVLVDSVAIQSFSNEEKDKEKLLSRFRIYITDAKNYSCDTYKEKIGLFYSVLKHTIALTLRTNHMGFLNVFLKKYLFAL
jgi:GT2 family glycosyltransferase